MTNIIQKEIYKLTKNIGASQNQKLLKIVFANTKNSSKYKIRVLSDLFNIIGQPSTLKPKWFKNIFLYLFSEYVGTG